MSRVATQTFSLSGRESGTITERVEETCNKWLQDNANKYKILAVNPARSANQGYHLFSLTVVYEELT